ncbi:DUF2189 domain-containing protein [Sphingomonas oligophenolica]|uniref:DUF2189 domain-containing protein n=1 Tax=Sphingomonas oligophenolica TaxID=301154 RepID=A0A502CE79_9SPHN|nr:DUF2189 domain-containing protein [Sphingomonas oligophenolica]TPG12005.1 DUF2189 domain-containing protein [Sphingomonas oligophenolica]
MTTQSAAAMPIASEVPEIRQLSSADLDWALRRGWKDFTERRGDLLFIGLLYSLVCLLAVYVALNQPLLPLLFPLVAGLSIAGPAVASGFYEIARRAEEGREANWWHFIDPLNGRSRTPLAALTSGLALLFLGWLLVAYVIYASTLGTDGAPNVSDFLARLFSTREGWTMIILGNLAGLGFAVATLVFTWVSFPMVVDTSVDAGVAVRTSVKAFRANPHAAIGWGLRVAALLALGTLPLGIGLAIVLPWLGYSTWHLYTAMVVR